MNKMKNLASLGLILFLLAFAACKSDSGSSGASGGKAKSDLKAAEGGAYYGGVFRMNETEYFRSLYPLNVTEVGGNRITNQIYEGLVQFDQKDLSIKPSLAESWTINDDATVYTFKMRKGVKFHDDPCFPDGKGREVTVQDMKWCLDRLCTYDVNNRGYDFFKDRIKGAPEHYEATKSGKKPPGGCKGVKIVDEETIQITLVQPFSGLLNLLALPFGYCYPPEAWNKYKEEMRIKTVGTGPFFMKAIRENDAVILAKNPNYWGKDDNGNQLPYLDAIRWSFIGDQKSELLAFKKGELDFMYRLPAEMIDEIIDVNNNLLGDYKKYQYQEKPSLSIQYYGFKLSEGRFADNKKLRQAFNYAIDRKKIVNYTVKGAGVPANHGMVPAAFDRYNYKGVKGYTFNPEKAKELMAEAGYPNGEGFGDLTLQINSGGKRNEQIAEAIQSMLKENLNINVKITKMPFAQHLEAIETSKTDFWRAGWVADYPDPENFVNLFYGPHIPEKLSDKSYLNTFRYRNAEVDALYEEAQRTIDEGARNELYRKADQLIVDDAPTIPIYYYKDRRMLQPNVRNYPQNAMEYRNLRDVYFVP